MWKEEQGTAVKETDTEREREEINKEGGKTHKCTRTHTQSQAVKHKLDRGSFRDPFDICSMHPIDICATYLNAFPFLLRGDGTHTESCDVIM